MNDTGVPKVKAELARAVEQLRDVLKVNAPIEAACETARTNLSTISSGSRRNEAQEALGRLDLAVSGSKKIAEQVQAAIEEIEKYSNSL